MDSKWIKYLNVRSEALKFLAENLGGKLLGNDFFGSDTKNKNKCDYIRFKSFCTTKETNKRKRQPTELEKILLRHIADGLISKIYREHNSIAKKYTSQTSRLKNGQRI